ncbi:PC-Esterase [Artemisia annua]|uniref:PC-Esterase n=1 Tax=Artemisia annua TaxID=35608 RepID=A0A2U1M8F5_ARTAN|nr:PC-Esterase [Artemisia annua]
MPTINILNGSFEDTEQYKLVDKHYGYNVALELWSTWLHSHVNHTRTKSYFMTMTAVHKRGEEWGRKVGTNCFNETEPIMNDGFWESGCDPEMMRILESSLNKLKGKGVNVQMVNISQLTQYRRDAYPSIYRRHYSPLTATQLSNPISYADCSHWCVPGVPDTWNELLLTDILQGQL